MNNSGKSRRTGSSSPSSSFPPNERASQPPTTTHGRYLCRLGPPRFGTSDARSPRPICPFILHYSGRYALPTTPRISEPLSPPPLVTILHTLLPLQPFTFPPTGHYLFNPDANGGQNEVTAAPTPMPVARKLASPSNFPHTRRRMVDKVAKRFSINPFDSGQPLERQLTEAKFQHLAL